jgi:CheY-like chemotaxis protein
MSDVSTGAPAPAAAPAAESAPSTENTENVNLEADVEEGSEEGDSSEAQKAKEDAAKVEKKLKEEIKKYKLKTDGNEEEVDESELIRRAQKATGAEKRMQESAQLKKDFINFIENLKSNPRKVLADPALSIDVVKFAQEVLSQQLEDEQKSPEQRELEQLKKEIEDIRAKEKADEEQRKQDDYNRSIAKYEQEFEQQFQEAIESSGLPKKPALLRKMAMIMDTALQNGKELTAKQAVSIAKKELESDVKEMMGALSDDGMESFLGKDLLKRIRKSNLQKIKAAPPTASDIKPISAKASEAQAEKKLSIKDWLKGK